MDETAGEITWDACRHELYHDKTNIKSAEAVHDTLPLCSFLLMQGKDTRVIEHKQNSDVDNSVEN